MPLGSAGSGFLWGREMAGETLILRGWGWGGRGEQRRDSSPSLSLSSWTREAGQLGGPQAGGKLFPWPDPRRPTVRGKFGVKGTGFYLWSHKVSRLEETSKIS